MEAVGPLQPPGAKKMRMDFLASSWLAKKAVSSLLADSLNVIMGSSKKGCG